jgi:hypothetical protein
MGRLSQAASLFVPNVSSSQVEPVSSAEVFNIVVEMSV